MPVRAADAAVGELVVARLAELRDGLGKSEEPKSLPKIDLSQQRTKLARKRERYLEAFSDGHTSRAELAIALLKVDAERSKLDAKERALAAPSILTDGVVRRAALASVGNLAKAWKLATGEERRKIVNFIAESVAIEVGKPPRPAWISREDFARAYA